MCFLACCGFKFNQKRGTKKAYHLVQSNVHQPICKEKIKGIEISKLHNLEAVGKWTTGKRVVFSNIEHYYQYRWRSN